MTGKTDREKRKEKRKEDYNMTKRIYGSTPKEDGFYMPGEFEKQDCVWMIWPQRPDNWRSNAAPAQKAYTEVAKAIAHRYGAGKGSLSCVLSLLKRYWISLPVPETWLSPCTKSCDPTISSVPTSR